MRTIAPAGVGTTLIGLSVVLLAVQSPAEGATRVERALARRISVGFVETPFERAIDYIRKEARVNIVIDRKIVGEGNLKALVTFQVDDIPAREALSWLGKLTGLDYEFHDKEIIVSTRWNVMRKRIVLKTYDIKTLARMFTQFPGPEMGPEGGEYGYGAGGGPIDISEDVVVARPLEAGIVADLIRESVQPTEWAAELGTSIESRDDMLVVMHTPEVHAEIETLLIQFTRRVNKMVSFEVSAFRMPSAAVDAALASCRPDGTLAEEGLRLADASTAAEQGRLLASTRFTCYDGQRVHSYGGRQGTYVSDYDATGAIYDPVVSSTSEGLLVDVTPIISGDDRHVMMSLKLTYAARMPEGAIDIRPFGPEDPDSEEGRAELDRADAPTPGAIRLQRTAMTSLRTSIRPRSGGTFLFSASSPEAGLPYDGNELVFLVKATPVSF